MELEDLDNNEQELPYVDIDPSVIAKYATIVQSPILKPAITTFAKNIGDISGMLDLPRIMLVMSTAQNNTHFKINKLVKENKKNNKITSEEDMREEIKNIIHQELNDPKLLANNYEEAHNFLRIILSMEKYQSSKKALLKSATIGIWSAFECLATDIWVEVVNTQPKILAQNIFKTDTNNEIEGIGRRSIEIGLLAKYEFDLRSSMGSLLKKKFDFTSVSGISKAYSGTFGTSIGIEEITQIKELKLLELLRNLLVHRGGIIDEDFHKIIKTRGEIGSEFPISGALVSTLAKLVIYTGYKLTDTIDTWLSEHPT